MPFSSAKEWLRSGAVFALNGDIGGASKTYQNLRSLLWNFFVTSLEEAVAIYELYASSK